ncbi:hypothetical protein ABFA07_003022 [Porites harrisoni]
MEENDEPTAPALQKSLYDKFKVQLSLRTIKRTRFKLGWRRSGSWYCQIVKEEDRVKRLEFPREYAETMNCSKTSSLLMRAAFGLTDSKLCFRKIGQPKKMKLTPKHP